MDDADAKQGTPTPINWERRYKTDGIAEIAAANPSVMDWIRHWETRASAAEAALAARDSRIAELEGALEIARSYVADVVKADGGIDECEITYRIALETVDAALARTAQQEDDDLSVELDIALDAAEENQ
jgi:hypothetical protein